MAKKTKRAEPTTDPFDGLMPAESIMAIAWVDGLRWALGKPEIMACFRRDTGCNYTPATNATDEMIDQQTGHQADFFRQFAQYWNQYYWGEEDGKPLDAGCEMGEE